MPARPTLDDVMADRGFTNADVASLATVSVRTVDRARAGKGVNPSSRKRMADVLDLTTDAFDAAVRQSRRAHARKAGSAA